MYIDFFILFARWFGLHFRYTHGAFHFTIRVSPSLQL